MRVWLGSLEKGREREEREEFFRADGKCLAKSQLDFFSELELELKLKLELELELELKLEFHCQQ